MVRFYDPNGSWESWGDFNAQDVHKQYAITFKSPSYALNEGAEGKTVLVELVKPSDESTSEPMEFTFLPRGQTTQPPAAPSSVQEKSRQEQKAPQVEGLSSLIDFCFILLCSRRTTIPWVRSGK